MTSAFDQIAIFVTDHLMPHFNHQLIEMLNKVVLTEEILSGRGGLIFLPVLGTMSISDAEHSLHSPM